MKTLYLREYLIPGVLHDDSVIKVPSISIHLYSSLFISIHPTAAEEVDA
jgi:hypothetical protein